MYTDTSYPYTYSEDVSAQGSSSRPQFGSGLLLAQSSVWLRAPWPNPALAALRGGATTIIIIIIIIIIIMM